MTNGAPLDITDLPTALQAHISAFLPLHDARLSTSTSTGMRELLQDAGMWRGLAEQRRLEAARLQESAAVVDEECKELRTKLSAKLADIRPSLESAMFALDAINKKDIYELRAMRTPPSPVIKTMAGVATLLGATDTDWDSCRKLMANPDSFLSSILGFDKDSISPEVLARAVKHLRDHDITPEGLPTAARGFCLWVDGIQQYNAEAGKVRAWRDEMNQAQKRADAALAEVKAAVAEAEYAEAQAARVQSKHDEAPTPTSAAMTSCEIACA